MSVSYEPVVGYCAFIPYEEGRKIEELDYTDEIIDSGYFGLIDSWIPSKGYFLGILRYFGDEDEKVINLENFSFPKETIDEFSELIKKHKELEKYIDKIEFCCFNRIF